MKDDMAVMDILDRVGESRRRRRCPNCDGLVSIRGFGGEYRWECLACTAIGIGYRTRAGALEDVMAARNAE